MQDELRQRVSEDITLDPNQTELTPAQEKVLQEVRDWWIDSVLKCRAGDKAEAESAVRQLYSDAGLEPPQFILWYSSPAAGCLAVSTIKAVSSLGIPYLPKQEDKLQAVYKQISDGISEGVRESITGCFDAAWMAFYDSFIRFGVKGCDRVKPIVDIAKNCGWWWMIRGVAVLTEKPTEFNLDERGRLHNADKCSIGFPDNWGIYVIHGIDVEKRWVLNPETVTVKEIDAQQNLEVRRILIEKYGRERFIMDSGAKLIDSEERWGDLYHREGNRGEEPLAFVLVTNRSPEPDGTFKKYALSVDPACRTAHEAVASTWVGVNIDDYYPEIET